MPSCVLMQHRIQSGSNPYVQLLDTALTSGGFSEDLVYYFRVGRLVSVPVISLKTSALLLRSESGRFFLDISSF